MRRPPVLASVPCLIVALLSACTLVPVCPAIAYTYSVDIQADQGDNLQLCIDMECATVDTSETLASGSTFSVQLRPLDDGAWRATFEMRTPPEIELRALDPEDKIIRSESFELEWTRTGGSEECGGPAETDPIDFRTRSVF